MNILGLHFGHDGAVCVLRDGLIASYVLRERHCRLKHAIGVTRADIDLALREAGIEIGDIEYCAVTSTQNIELLVGLVNGLEIRTVAHPKCAAFPSPFVELLAQRGLSPANVQTSSLQQILASGAPELQYAAYSAVCVEREKVARGEIASVGWIDNYVMLDQWQQGATLEEMSRRNVAALLDSAALKYGFHLPATVVLDGRELPAFFVQHHMAHAASVYYRAGYREAAVLTHDGFGNGVGYQSGLIFYGRGHELFPLAPHHLAIGALYDHTSLALKLHAAGVAGMQGKLMGLAPYGKPVFFHHALVGNWYEMQRRFKQDQVGTWLRFCRQMAENMGYDMSALGVKARMTEPANADIAASTQKLFEECYLYAVSMAKVMLLNSRIATDNLCLSGGTALNCPSNSRLYRESPFRSIFVEPSCSDDGLAIGCALYVHHQLAAAPLPAKGNGELASPYLGVPVQKREIVEALRRYEGRVTARSAANPARQAAQDLKADRVVGWFEGRSEVGPRALGHRSILANPTIKENWQRVNAIKQREVWRPFAPAVLEDAAAEWFSGMPAASPYMLFTAQVRSDRLPAITHVDGSARIQTVGSQCGAFYDVLREFRELTGVPVVLNTSFNGPGEPIVEKPAEALDFLLTSKLDALYMGDFRITRAAK
ncbi:MAG: carbamoyltransferase C-terminal domain-containing protein [Pseudomonadota bacterium]